MQLLCPWFFARHLDMQMERLETLYHDTFEHHKWYYTLLLLKVTSLLQKCGEGNTETLIIEEVMCNLQMHLSTLMNCLLQFNLQKNPTQGQ